jgi:filamentous hemagglutinin family protein
MRVPVLRTLLASCTVLASLVCVPVTLAQITLDGSLRPGAPSGALPGPDYSIPHTVGEVRGSNLFHSFGRFSILAGESATFTGPTGIANVLSRVTGGEASIIDGTLRSTMPGANFFLLNPSGILVGPNAVLDVGGSVHFSTADFVRFTDGTRFSSSVSGETILSVAAPAAFGFLGPTAGSIAVEGATLQVPDTAALSIVAGDVSITGGTLLAPGGRVQIASVASAGEVALRPDQSIELEAGAAPALLGRIDITGFSTLDASGDPAGTIAIRGGRLFVDASALSSNTVDLDAPRPAIDLQLAEEITLINLASVTTDSLGAGRGGDVLLSAPVIRLGDVFSEGGFVQTHGSGSGAAGDISISGGVVSIVNGGFVVSRGFSFFDPAPGGNVTVIASESIEVLGSDFFGTASTIATETFSPGDAGKVMVSAPSITLDRGGTIASRSLGEGRGGDVSITADGLTVTGGGRIESNAASLGAGGAIDVTGGSVVLSGLGEFGNPSGIFSGGLSGAGFGENPPGTIALNVDMLALSDGAVIESGSLFEPQGGSIIIAASQSISVSGVGSRIASQAFALDAGQITFTTPAFTLDGGTVTTTTVEAGNAAPISLTVGSLRLLNGGRIESSTDGLASGAGGDLTVNATGLVSIAGSGGGLASGLFSTAASVGDAGRITVNAPTITVSEGGQVSVATSGAGAAGAVTLTASTLAVTGGARVDSSTTADGAGGSLVATAGGTLTVEGAGSGFFSTTTSSGAGGAIELGGGTVRLDDGATVSASSAGAGNAGTVGITASTIALGGGAEVSVATSGTGNAGQAVLSAGTFTMTGGARLDSGTQGAGAGGRLDVAATGSVTIGGSGTGLFSNATSTGAGGDIDVAAPTVGLANRARISATSSGTGLAGDISITANSFVQTGNSVVTTDATQADGGNITITAVSRVELRNSEITTSVASGVGGGGNISIDPELVLLDNSLIRADAFGGPGGNVSIVAGIFLSTESTLSASSALGVPGTVNVDAQISDLSSSVAQLPESVLQAASLLRASCGTRMADAKASTLVAAGRDRLPSEPGGLLPSSLLAEVPDRRVDWYPAHRWDALLVAPRLLLASSCTR